MRAGDGWPSLQGEPDVLDVDRRAMIICGQDLDDLRFERVRCSPQRHRAANPLACTLAWKDLSDKGMAGTLLKNGAYSGSSTGPFNTKCGSHLGTDTLTVHFHVTRAHASDGEWVASQMVGTFQLYAPAVFGCVTATAAVVEDHGDRASGAKRAHFDDGAVHRDWFGGDRQLAPDGQPLDLVVLHQQDGLDLGFRCTLISSHSGG